MQRMQRDQSTIRIAGKKSNRSSDHMKRERERERERFLKWKAELFLVVLFCTSTQAQWLLSSSMQPRTEGPQPLHMEMAHFFFLMATCHDKQLWVMKCQLFFQHTKHKVMNCSNKNVHVLVGFSVNTYAISETLFGRLYSVKNCYWVCGRWKAHPLPRIT